MALSSHRQRDRVMSDRLSGWPGRAPNHSDGVVESQTDRQTNRQTERQSNVTYIRTLGVTQGNLPTKSVSSQHRLSGWAGRAPNRVTPMALSSHRQTDRQTSRQTEKQSNERQNPRVTTNLPTKFHLGAGWVSGWVGRQIIPMALPVESQTDRQTRETDRRIESLVHLPQN